jgi:hypothetical protein
VEKNGRSVLRRLNRYEYENTVRDLLEAPWLQLRDMLPEDGEAHRFNKVGEALDISHVQMARYLGAADYAFHQVLAPQVDKPATSTVRYHAREQSAFSRRINLGGPLVRRTFPVLGSEAQPEVLALAGGGIKPKPGEVRLDATIKDSLTVGAADPVVRELEAMGVVVSSYEPTELSFNGFRAPVAGRYKLRFAGSSIWVGPAPGAKWWIPDFTRIYPGRRSEPITIYSETPPRLLRKLGSFDFAPESGVKELDVWLLAGEGIRPDASRLFRARPPEFRNPLAEPDGMPGAAFRWMEVTGPILEQWPTAGHRLLFGELPLQARPPQGGKPAGVEVLSVEREKDAAKLLGNFLRRAYRRPVTEAEVAAFLPIVRKAWEGGQSFSEGLIFGYTAVLCSPGFLYLEEKPGRLDDHALAARLSCFLWNSAPDDALVRLADEGQLRQPEVLRAQTERLLDDPKSARFIEAFLDYWLDLRKLAASAPDASLYPDYQLDDLLVESMTEETQLFFGELLRRNLGAKNLVDSDFAMLNERLAVHYGMAGIIGVGLRKVALAPGGARGGLMTQASVLKVTANGTTTSPVIRGAWIMERVLGQAPPPPPPSVPAVEPDIRGATTIREQLDKHRSQESCAGCHRKIDPAGFALENFDVMGGWRDTYRALGEGQPLKGFGHHGLAFAFHNGLKVDASGQLPDGPAFKDIIELKALLLKNQPVLARNLVAQMLVFATGAAVGFADRAEVEAIVGRSEADGYGVRTLLHALVQSPLFQTK